VRTSTPFLCADHLVVLGLNTPIMWRVQILKLPIATLPNQRSVYGSMCSLTPLDRANLLMELKMFRLVPAFPTFRETQCSLPHSYSERYRKRRNIYIQIILSVYWIKCMYVCIYIYMCVCVCMCVRARARASVCSLYLHFQTVAPISVKFGMMVENLHGEVSDTSDPKWFKLKYPPGFGN
jgi:hypothetical protein